jgi:hypothetical protein
MTFLGLCLFSTGIALILNGRACVPNGGAAATAFINLLFDNFLGGTAAARLSLSRGREARHG